MNTFSCGIGGLTVSSPLALAPVADLTHAVFREMVAELGGCGLFYTEMLNARIVASQPFKGDPYLTKGEHDRPLVAQLVGNDPQKMATAAKRLADAGFDAIDINMGCSRARLMKFGWGLGLMEDREQAARVVAMVRAAVDLPLLVKMRSGKDHDLERMLGFGTDLAQWGVNAICLHPRSGEDGFKRPSRWSEIAALVKALPIPVIGNGDVLTPVDAGRMVRETGCAMVMIGRGALIRPWLFAEIVSQTSWTGDPLALIGRYVDLLHQYLPVEIHRSRFLLFLGWYLRNWPFHREIFSGVRKEKDVSAMLSLLAQELPTDPAAIMQTPFAGRL